mmetsp:Transcript_11171/g.40968  ORF Transcript_11171/g.40968 Transcript_11171/m.40968 type:complete len:438 (-) Transcript_11171:1341-2654(-)
MVVYCSQALLPSPLTHSSTDVRPSSATKSARHLHLHSLAGCATRSTVLRRWGPRTPMHILASGGQPTPAHSPQSAAHKSEPSEQRTNGARSKGGKVLQLDDVGFYGAVEDVRAKDQAKLNVWSDARILAVEELAAGKRLLRVEHEVSRMLVHIKDAYTGVGRLAQLRLVPSEPQQLVGDDEVQQPEARVFTLKPASPPVAFELLERSVYKLRGDISAGQTKVDETAVTTAGVLEVVVQETDHPELFRLQAWNDPEDAAGKEVLQVGPFVGLPIDLRKLMFVHGFPTLLLVAEGDDVVSAKALLEATRGGLDMEAREAIRVYNLLHAPEEAILEERLQELERVRSNLKVCQVVRSKTSPLGKALMMAFDADDELEYEPEATGVILLTESSHERTRKDVLEFMSHAEIPEDNLVCVDMTLETKLTRGVTNEEKRERGIA